MSTLPSDTASSGHPPPVMTAARGDGQFDKLVRDFIIAAGQPDVSPFSETELRGLCREVADFTEELFPGEMTIELRRDYEIPDDNYFVVDVGATGTTEEVMARIKQWHLALQQVAGGRADLFCLSFDMH